MTREEFIQELIEISCKKYFQTEDEKQVVLKDITQENAIERILQAVFVKGACAQMISTQAAVNFYNACNPLNPVSIPVNPYGFPPVPVQNVSLNTQLKTQLNLQNTK